MTSKAIIQTALGPRLARVEEKLDAYIEGKGAAAAAPNPTPPRSPEEEALQRLSLMLGSGEWSLPPQVDIERHMNLNTGETHVSAIVYGEHLRMSLSEAYHLNVLGLTGQFNHPRAQQLLFAVSPPSARLHNAAARPASQPRF
jgi:hypothetical protein